MNFSMNFLNNTDTNAETAPSRADVCAVLVCEAGIPFRPLLDSACGIDPITEWLGLMEVVQMLCPVWPVRDRPMQGDYWRL